MTTARPDTASRLRAFISRSPSQKLTAENVIDLYRQSKQPLLPHELSALISLFGTLSFPTAFRRFTSPLVSTLRPSESAQYWSFVQELIHHKLSPNVHLTDSDQYWAMLAHITQANLPGATHHARSSSLSAASSHYQRLWTRTASADLHSPFLDALLSMESQSWYEIAIRTLCRVLIRFEYPDARILDFLWTRILSGELALSMPLKEAILDALCVRLHTFNSLAPVVSSKPQVERPRHRYDQISHRHVRLPIDVPLLAATLRKSLFRHGQDSVPIQLQHWASTYISAVFHRRRTLEARWNSLLLAAMYYVPSAVPASLPPSMSIESLGKDVVDWHVIWTLGILQKNVQDGDAQAVRHITRSLWRVWRDDAMERPGLVTRAIAGAFFRACALTRDAPLLEGCMRHCTQRGLLDRIDRDTSTALEWSQARSLLADYCVAHVRCKVGGWEGLLGAMSSLGAGSWGSEEVVHILFEHLLSVQDLSALHELYAFCLVRGLPLSSKVAHTVGVVLARDWVNLSISLLGESKFSVKQQEQLLSAIMQSFRHQRLHFLQPQSATAVADALERLYTSHRTPTRLMSKHSLGFSLPLLIGSGQGKKVLRVIQTIYSSAPSFFSRRYLLVRVLKSLIRHREFKLAVHMVGLLRRWSPPSADHFRRHLLKGLAHGGARALARRVRLSLAVRQPRRSYDFARRGSFRVPSPSRGPGLRMFPLRDVRAAPLRKIRNIFYILVNGRRPAAARMVYIRSQKRLDQRSNTYMGNIYLHRLLLRTGTKNRQILKKMISARYFLVRRLGFVEDRVTVNILVKALLCWTSGFDSGRMKLLFDHLARLGYPVGSRWREKNGVPFGSEESIWLERLGLSAHGPLSFERHVRPLYKMFVKAFHLRKDHSSASLVVGVLKEEEAREIRRKERESRARVFGRQKKKKTKL